MKNSEQTLAELSKKTRTQLGYSLHDWTRVVGFSSVKIENGSFKSDKARQNILRVKEMES